MPWISLTHIGQLNPYGAQAAVDHMPVLPGHVRVGGHGTTAQSTSVFLCMHLLSANHKAMESNASAPMMHRHRRENWQNSSLPLRRGIFFRLGWRRDSLTSLRGGTLQEITHMMMMLARAPRVAAALVRSGQTIMCNSVLTYSCTLHVFFMNLLFFEYAYLNETSLGQHAL